MPLLQRIHVLQGVSVHRQEVCHLPPLDGSKIFFTTEARGRLGSCASDRVHCSHAQINVRLEFTDVREEFVELEIAANICAHHDPHSSAHHVLQILPSNL